MSGEGTAPEGGQGTTTEESGGLFDTYLQAVPEDAREYVTGYLKDAEKNVNSRLSEAADIQKSLGPYKDIAGDLSQYDPQQLQSLLQWHQQIGQSEETYNQWLKQAAQEAGLTLAEAEAALNEEEPTIQQIQEAAEQRALATVQPFAQEFEAFKQEQAISSMEQHITSEFARLEAESGVKLTEDIQKAIVDLGETHQGDDWIKVGFDRYRALAGAAQADFVADKTTAPKPPLTSGGQGAPPRITSFEEAGIQARERLRQALAT